MHDYQRYCLLHQFRVVFGTPFELFSHYYCCWNSPQGVCVCLSSYSQHQSRIVLAHAFNTPVYCCKIFPKMSATKFCWPWVVHVSAAIAIISAVLCKLKISCCRKFVLISEYNIMHMFNVLIDNRTSIAYGCRWGHSMHITCMRNGYFASWMLVSFI